MPSSEPNSGAAATELPLTTVWPGSSYPLGATFDGGGTNFALFSEIADKVELCLIDDAGEESRIRLDEVDGYVWSRRSILHDVQRNRQGKAAHAISNYIAAHSAKNLLSDTRVSI